jgi:hypothetical protein
LTSVLTVPNEDLRTLRPALSSAPGPIVIDHCGFPAYRDGVIAPGDPVLEFADADDVYLKVSTHCFDHAGDDPARLVEQLVAVFGATRLLWGSDHPQTITDLQSAVAAARRGVRTLSPADQASVLGGLADALFMGAAQADADLFDHVNSLLAPLARSLEADGFWLTTALEPGVVHLHVDATPAACADCLVPRKVFAGIAHDRLRRGGVDVEVSVSYPPESAVET